MTSNHLRLVAAMNQGYSGIPITQYMKFDNDIQLNIVENYLIKLIHYNDSESKNHKDFGILLKTVNNSVMNRYMSEREVPAENGA